MKIGVISLGCAKNLVDTENLLGILTASDQEIVKDPAEAEAIIINTCGFIESAKVEAIDTIFSVSDLKETGLKKLIVMGCLSTRYKSDLEAEMPEVDRFISIDEYGQLGEILSQELGVRIINNYGKTPRVLSGKPWMAYLRIADGCDNRCSYCAIPIIRGNMHSVKEEEIIAEAERLIASGVKELNLIAQDSSRYGYDLDGQLHLSSLLKKLDVLEGVRWIRVLYLYPDEIPDDLIDTMRSCGHVLPYFDIPVQHGNDRILKAMNRRGSRQLIIERCAKIRKELPEAVLRTTLITGFPSESESEHQDTLSLMREVRFDHLGAFTYSSEEDTAAYEMKDDVPAEVKERRLSEIMALQAEISEELLSSRVDTLMDVLVESRDDLTSMYVGRSALFAPDGVDGCVRFRSSRDLKAGDIVTVRIKRAAGHNLIGETA